MKKLLTIIAIMAFIFGTTGMALASSSASVNDVNANASLSTGDIGSQNAQSVTVNLPANEQKDLTTTQNQGHGYRGFAMQPQMTYAPLPGYFGPATRNAECQKAETILMYKNVFTRIEIEEYLKTAGSTVPARKDGQKDNDTITVLTKPVPRDQVTQKALITMKAKDTDTGSKVVLLRAALSAMNYGGDILLVTAEGASTELHSFGWGIGLAYTHSRISAGENEGGTGSGGFGISGGTAGYGSLTWVQGIALKVK